MAMPPMMGPNHQQQMKDFMHQREQAQYLKQQRANTQQPPKDLMEQAAEHYRHRRFAEASAIYQQLTAVPLLADQAYCNLGVIALMQGDKATAGQQFRQSLAANPGYANALYYLGDMAEKSGDAAAALDYQRRALAASPAHAGAGAAVARLASATGGSASAPAAMSPAPGVVPDTSGVPPPNPGLGVYEYLRADSSLLSRQTVVALAAVNFHRGSALAAWFGQLLLRLLMWTGVFVGVSILRLSSGADYDEDLVWLPAGAHLLIFALRAVTTKYTLDTGRLTVSRGLIWRRTTRTELWRIQTIDLQQGLVDRITGHGALIFRGVSASTRRIEVRGVARGAQLRELHQQLVDLVFLLRGNSVVKGIIS
jgi:hypothetical protein